MMRVGILWIIVAVISYAKGGSAVQSIYDFEINRLDGKTVKMSEYKGKVLLIVNTASKCGFTPQYEGLEALYDKFKSKGLVVLGFPCNQFGNQEPGDSDAIANFCQVNFGVSFPMFEKIEVNGKNTHALYRYLKAAQSGIMGFKAIKWNFTKFLVDKEGQVVKRFAPATKPKELESAIESLL